MSVSPFAQHGARLIQRGYSVIPIAPGTKYPGEFRHGEWCAMRDWPRYADRAPTKWEIPFWEKWPGAGVGVVFGPASGDLIGVDIDTDVPEIVAAIRAAVPPTTVKKFGAKGCTFFYRGPGIQSKSWNINGARVLDLLGPGRQAVLPPSIHPTLEAPYRWLGPDPLDYVPPSALPVLPVDAAESIGQALAPFGYKAEPERVPTAGGTVRDDSESAFRAINNAALANLEAWVPMLGLYRCRRTGRGYQAVATWRASNGGRPAEQRKLNLHVTPEGINDFGDGPRKFSALDLVMAAKSCEWPEAFKTLSDALGVGAGVTIALRPKGK
jgi:hypothetical protein